MRARSSSSVPEIRRSRRAISSRRARTSSSASRRIWLASSFASVSARLRVWAASCSAWTRVCWALRLDRVGVGRRHRRADHEPGGDAHGQRDDADDDGDHRSLPFVACSGRGPDGPPFRWWRRCARASSGAWILGSSALRSRSGPMSSISRVCSRRCRFDERQMSVRLPLGSFPERLRPAPRQGKVGGERQSSAASRPRARRAADRATSGG